MNGSAGRVILLLPALICRKRLEGILAALNQPPYYYVTRVIQSGKI